MEDQEDHIVQPHRRETEEERAPEVETLQEQRPDHTTEEANQSTRVGGGYTSEKPLVPEKKD